MSKGIRTEWDSNPRPSDYESRARTTTPQCSHYFESKSYMPSLQVLIKVRLIWHEQLFHTLLTRSLREPGGPCTKAMDVPESRMERVKWCEKEQPSDKGWKKGTQDMLYKLLISF